MDSTSGSPEKRRALARSSPAYVSYRRFVHERTSGMRSASSARLKVGKHWADLCLRCSANVGRKWLSVGTHMLSICRLQS